MSEEAVATRIHQKIQAKGQARVVFIAPSNAVHSYPATDGDRIPHARLIGVYDTRPTAAMIEEDIAAAFAEAAAHG